MSKAGQATLTKTPTGLGISHMAEFRDGHCPDCNNILDHGVFGKMPSRYCPNCKDWKVGKLIAKEVSLQPPRPPLCLRVGCIWKYFWEVLVYSAISTYEARRFAYAVKNRHKKILERYRTGEPRPKTFWQAIHANLKLTCPLCRKYNVDQFLFRRLKHGTD